jgi:hypothetical protein
VRGSARRGARQHSIGGAVSEVECGAAREAALGVPVSNALNSARAARGPLEGLRSEVVLTATMWERCYGKGMVAELGSEGVLVTMREKRGNGEVTE